MASDQICRDFQSGQKFGLELLFGSEGCPVERSVDPPRPCSKLPNFGCIWTRVKHILPGSEQSVANFITLRHSSFHLDRFVAQMLQEIVGTTTDCGRNRRKWNFRQYFTSGFRLISIYASLDTNNRWAVSFRETNKLFRCHRLHSVQQGPRELCTLVYIHVWAVYTPHTPLLMIPVKSFQYTLYIHVWAVYTPLLIVPVKSVFSYEMCIYTCLSSLYSTSLLIVPVKSEHECVLIWNVIYFFEWKCRSGSYNRDLWPIKQQRSSSNLFLILKKP